MPKKTTRATLLDRRSALRLLGGGVGAVILVGCGGGDDASASTSSSSSSSSSDTTTTTTAGTVSCTQSKAMTQGPYWVDEKLNRSDIRADTSGSGGTQAGALLTLTLLIADYASGGCTPEAGVWVDIWHANALGVYSDVASQSTTGQNFLRGYQLSDSNGQVSFTTIFPGWYVSRAPHIHVRVRRVDSAGNVTYNNTTQLFFAQSTIAAVYAANAPYNTRSQVQPDTSNTADSLYVAALEVPLTASGSGYTGNITLGLPLNGAGN